MVKAKAEIWIHGSRAQSISQVISYLKGDAHDRSKIQVFIDGEFYDVDTNSLRPLGRN